MPRCRSVCLTTIASLLAACAVLLAVAVRPPSAWASGNANWGTGVELAPPGNAGPDPEVVLEEVSCPSAGECAAAGTYTELVGVYPNTKVQKQAMLLSQTGGTWGPVVEVAMPAGAASNPRVEFYALSCPSAGNCTAVGQYRETEESGPERAFLLDENAGTWEPAVEVSLPGDASSDQVVLDELSCPSAGNCVAAGNYVTSSYQWRGFVMTETEGKWGTAVEPSLPANATPNSEDWLGGVSCASVGDCTAVGYYTDSAGHEGLLLTQTGGTWGTGAEATLPEHAASDAKVALYGVSCPSAENCVAVGDYTDSGGDGEGLMLDETSGTWGTGVEASLPAGARAEPGGAVIRVQCPSVGNCSAVGSYVAANPEQVDGVLLSETSGVWAAGVKAQLPANAELVQLTTFNEGSLSCPSAGDCTYAGHYKANGEIWHALLLTESNGTWGPGTEATLPANHTYDPGAYLTSVSCTSPGSCTAVGSYNSHKTETLVEREGMIFTATPATADLSVSGPLGGAFAGSPIAASQISAALAGGSAPTGTITFTVFGPQSSPPSSCVSGGTPVGSASAYGDGTYHPSGSFTPPGPGDYWWYASYGGDVGDEPSASTCGPAMAQTTVLPKATPTLSASGPIGAFAGSAIAGSSISATLAKGSSPTGTITFAVFGPRSSPPSSCVSGGTTVGTASVSGEGAYQPSAGFTPATPGDYWWYASYSGDAGDEPAASACGASMAETVVAAPQATGSGSGSSAGSSTGPTPGPGPGAQTSVKPPAPALSRVTLASKHPTAAKGVAVKLTVSEAATINVVIAQSVKGHKLRGVCKPGAKKGSRCTTTVTRRTLTFSASAGSNTLKVKLAGLHKGSYTATITARNANGHSNSVTLTFTVNPR